MTNGTLRQALAFATSGWPVLPCLPGLVGGLALTALKVADYVARTNPSRPDGDAEKPLRRAWKSRALPMSA